MPELLDGDSTSSFFEKHSLRAVEGELDLAQIDAFGRPAESVTAEAVGRQCEEAVPYSAFYQVIVDGQLVARCTHTPPHTVVIAG